MNRFHRHIPNFCDDRGMDRTPFEFETKEQLFAAPHVAPWAKDLSHRKFVGFRMSGNHLMVIHDDGFHFWVVGSVEHPVPGIEPWEGWKMRVMLPSGEVKVMVGSEIRSACGGVLTLADGSLALDVTDGVPPDAEERVKNLTHPQEVWTIKDNDTGEWRNSTAIEVNGGLPFYGQKPEIRDNKIHDLGVPDPAAGSKFLKGLGGDKKQ